MIISGDPKLFTYLTRCAPAVRVVFGDARLALARVRAGAFDLLVLDAFSSDAIPVHLLTPQVGIPWETPLGFGPYIFPVK